LLRRTLADPALVRRRYHVRLDQRARSPASPDGAPAKDTDGAGDGGQDLSAGQQFVILARNPH
jgi:hypothetical protein